MNTVTPTAPLHLAQRQPQLGLHYYIPVAAMLAALLAADMTIDHGEVGGVQRAAPVWNLAPYSTNDVTQLAE